MTERKTERVALVVAYFLMVGALLWLAVLTEAQHGDTREVVQGAEESIERIEDSILAAICVDAEIDYATSAILLESLPQSEKAALTKMEEAYREICPDAILELDSKEG